MSFVRWVSELLCKILGHKWRVDLIHAGMRTVGTISTCERCGRNESEISVVEIDRSLLI